MYRFGIISTLLSSLISLQVLHSIVVLLEVSLIEAPVLNDNPRQVTRQVLVKWRIIVELACKVWETLLQCEKAERVLDAREGERSEWRILKHHPFIRF